MMPNGPRCVPRRKPHRSPRTRRSLCVRRRPVAWSRTALALVVAGLGVVQLLPPFPGVPWGRHVLGVPLIVFGAVVAVAAYGEWVRSQRALRLGQPLPRSVMPRLLTAVIAAIAAIAARSEEHTSELQSRGQ